MSQLSVVQPRAEVSAATVSSAHDRTRRIIVAGLLVTAAVVTVQAATQAIDFDVFNLRIWELNADKHDSLFGLASLLAQSAVAAASWWRGSRWNGDGGPGSRWERSCGFLVLMRGLTAYNASDAGWSACVCVRPVVLADVARSTRRPNRRLGRPHPDGDIVAAARGGPRCGCEPASDYTWVVSDHGHR